MPSLRMTHDERNAFLAGRHVGIIAIEQPDAPPLAVPIWYDYRPERGLWFLTGPESLKGRLLLVAGRLALCAQTEEAPYKYVSVEGPIVSTEPADRERDTRPMARRYLGDEGGDAYVVQTGDLESIVVTMKPQVWRTVDYSKMSLG